MPQIVCWQFQDFLPVLFPDFIRGHFRKEQMAQFVSENVDCFTVDGVERACTVELFSGQRFQSTLTVQASFFTAKGPEVLQHWHLSMGANQVELQSHGAVPIGINLDNHARREELRKKAKEYIHALTAEPQFAEQVTDSTRHTGLPRKILAMAQRFAQRSDVSTRSGDGMPTVGWAALRGTPLTRQENSRPWSRRPSPSTRCTTS